jgi:hypothetical protein
MQRLKTPAIDAPPATQALLKAAAISGSLKLSLGYNARHSKRHSPPRWFYSIFALLLQGKIRTRSGIAAPTARNAVAAVPSMAFLTRNSFSPNLIFVTLT